MQLQIEHLTRYRYSLAVQLARHTLRLLPIERPAQQTLFSGVQVDPLPAARNQGQDAWGNRTETVDFQGLSDHLEVRARLTVATGSGPDPVVPDFALNGIDPAAPDIPPAYLARLEDPSILQRFNAPLLQASGGSGLTFLERLTDTLSGFHHPGLRADGPPRKPGDTLASHTGVCRDISLLFIALCRQAGLGARFVSGYQYAEGAGSQQFLHAWAEVSVPGFGWLGFDPTLGSRTGPGHVAIAAAPDPAQVTPIEGGYRFDGPRLSSTLDTDIRITGS